MDLVGGIAGGKIEQVAIAEGEDFCINGATAVPIPCWAEDRVGGVSGEPDAIIGNGMADRVFRTVAVGLVEEMDLLADDQRTGGGQSVFFRFGFRGDLRDFCPPLQIPAFRNADAQTFYRMGFVFMCRKRVIHQISTVELHHMRIFGEGAAQTGGVAKEHGRRFLGHAYASYEG